MRFLSLFSGIEGASLAFAPLGWECVAVAEISPFPCALLAERFPDVPNLGDITTITREQIESLGPIDLVIGGFPCQDVSIAGRRAGLRTTDGEATRSGLFFDAMRVVEWTRARWLVIENVPGLFSTHAGRDFAAVAGAMAGCEFGVPPDGWRNSGAAVGPLGLVEWGCLDAQFFGLAQRRNRVFLVRDSGDWTNRPPVLLESESMQGDHAPRRETGKSVAGTIRSRTGGGCGPGPDDAAAGKLIGTVATLDASFGRLQGASHQDANHGHSHLIPFDTTQLTHPENRSRPEDGDPSPTLAADGHPPSVAYAFQTRIGRNDRGDMGDVVNALTAHAGRTGKGDSAPCVAFGGNNQEGEIDLATARNAHPTSRMDFGTETFVIDRSPADADVYPQERLYYTRFRCIACARVYGLEDYDRNPTCPDCGSMQCDDALDYEDTCDEGFPLGTAYALRSDAGRDGEAKTPSADAEGNVRDPGFNVLHELAPTLDAGAPHTVAHTLRGEGHDATEDGSGRGTPLVAFTCKDLAPTLRAMNEQDGNANAGGQVAVAFSDLADPVAANQARTYTREGTNNFRVSNVAIARAGVRRLTPLECERLQGVPDFWTLITYRGKPAPDGPRYAAIGNGFAVPVVRWIGERIMAVMGLR